MKVALVHDYLNEYGGAERVLEALSEIFPKAPIYTAFVRKDSSAYKRFKSKKIITSWAQNVPFFASRLHSPLRFLAPLIWNSLDFSEYDVVITSASWYVTKGVGKRSGLSSDETGAKGQTLDKLSFTEVSDGKPIEICYCHTPPRYLYGYTTATNINRNFLIKVYALIVNHFMRVYDFEAAQRVDYFIANSREVAARIKKFYRRESTVIYPPVDTSAYSKNKRIASSKGKSLNANSYFLVVSRLVASKNVDVVVEVCTKLGLPLKVVGAGREMANLKKLVGKFIPKKNVILSDSEGSRDSSASPQNDSHSTVEFLGDVNDEELISLYQNCRAVIFAASQEDFGLVPVEAMAAGKPVIVNAEGGVLESVVDAIPAGKGKGTGVYFELARNKPSYFDPPTAGSLTLAINNFVDLEKKGYFNANFIRFHAQKFSKERFKKEILKFMGSKVR